jgi:hypothetical protein
VGRPSKPKTSKPSKRDKKQAAMPQAGADPIREWEVTKPLSMEMVFEAFKKIGETGKRVRALRDARKNMNEEIKTAQGHLDTLLEETETLSTKVYVKVKEVPDFAAKLVKIVRTDMPEDDPAAVVSTRAMTGGEIQAGSTLNPGQVKQALAGVAKAGEKVTRGNFDFTGDEPPPKVEADPKLVDSLKSALH